MQSGRFGPGNGLPSTFTYLNLGSVRQKGVELGVEGLVTDTLTAYVNYSYQPEPEPDGFDISELNLPSQHHFNVGAGYNGAEVARQRRRQLRELGVLAGRARLALPRPDRGLHDRHRRRSATSGAAIGW